MVNEKKAEIVKINFDEPKKRLPKVFKESAEIVREIKRGNIKNGETIILDESEYADKMKKEIVIQNIKKEKKASLKPQESEIQEEKAIENPEIDKIEDLQKEIDNQKIALELRIKEAKEEQKKLLTELKLKAKTEKKELKLKKKAEKREKRRKHWYFRMFMRKPKVPVIQEIVYQNPNEIKLIELDYTNLKRCPICNKKLKKTKVIYDFNILKQTLKCKKCNFKKEIAIKL